MSERLLFTVDEPERVHPADEPPVRYFLVPRERLAARSADPIPAGELVLRTVDGQRFALSAEDLALFEVDRARAISALDMSIERLVAPVRDLWGAEERLRVFGVTPGEALIDPVLRRQARRRLLEQAGRIVRPGITEDELDDVEGRLGSFGGAATREAERLRTAGQRAWEELDAAVGTAERRVSEFGQQLFSSIRDLAGGRADREDEER